MLVAAKDLQTQYEKALDSASITRELRPHFRKWLRFRTFTTVEVQCAAFHAKLAESAAGRRRYTDPRRWRFGARCLRIRGQD